MLAAQCRKTERGTLWGFSTSILSQNIKKLKGGKSFIFGKNLTVPKKTVRGALWDFPTSILTQNSKKMKGDHLGKIFPEKKSRSAEKNERGDPLVSLGMVCYAEKHFWFSSLCQIVQLYFVELSRTILVSSCG